MVGGLDVSISLNSVFQGAFYSPVTYRNDGANGAPYSRVHQSIIFDASHSNSAYKAEAQYVRPISLKVCYFIKF